jgi:hypothetical protein
MSATRWVTLVVAADSLDMAATALRRTIERRARLATDGVLEADFDGIRARKFAGRWRVNLGPAGTPPRPIARPTVRVLLFPLVPRTRPLEKE